MREKPWLERLAALLLAVLIAASPVRAAQEEIPRLDASDAASSGAGRLDETIQSAAEFPSFNPDLNAQTGLNSEIPSEAERVSAPREDLPPAGPYRYALAAFVKDAAASGEPSDESPESTYRFLRPFLSHRRITVEQLRATGRPDVLLGSMYRILRDIVGSDMSESRRYKIASAMSKRFGNFLEKASKDPGLDLAVSAHFDYVARNFLSNQLLVVQFAHKRRLDFKICALAQRVGFGVEKNKVQLPWQIPAPTSVEKRRSRDELKINRNSFRQAERRIERSLFRLEKLEARLRLAQAAGLPDRLIGQLRKSLANYKWRAKRELAQHIGFADFLFDFVLPGVFDDPFFYTSELEVRKVQGLELEHDGSLWRVTASFEHMISDERVLASVKRSIEDYWSGPVTVDGKKERMEVTVLFKRVLHFSRNGLRLEEGPRSEAIGGKAIFLSRHFDYATPAHEFGHAAFFLPDEYNLGFDPKTGERVVALNRGSLMSGHATGIVQERHRLAAIRNLQISLKSRSRLSRLKAQLLRFLRQASTMWGAERPYFS